MMPAADAAGTPHIVDRKAALAAAALLETPAAAWERKQRGEPTPDHYTATPPAGAKGGESTASPYATAAPKPKAGVFETAAE